MYISTLHTHIPVNGSRTLPIAPKKTDPGPVDETVSYTPSASNGCGGSETKTATLHIVGLIEADTGLALNSVYFPTDLPRSIRTREGLVLSQQATLTSIAHAFKKYLEYNSDANLTLIGHADKRGESGYNKALSERRAEVAKDFLIAQGVPADHLETEGRGADQNLADDQVKQLVEQNPELAETEREKALEKLYTLVLAHNRRVDITLSTTGQESSHQYPFKAEDFATLINRNRINKEIVQMAAEKKDRELTWRSEVMSALNGREIACSSECTEQYAQKGFDSADTVREGILQQLRSESAKRFNPLHAYGASDCGGRLWASSVLVG